MLHGKSFHLVLSRFPMYSDNKTNVRHDLQLNSIMHNLLVQKLVYNILSIKNSFKKKKQCYSFSSF